MNEPVAQPAFAPRWMRWLLAVSLALNLAVVGLMAGAILRDGGPSGRMGRDLDLGPLSEALDRDDRLALREAFLERNPDLRQGRARLREDFQALTEALRAEPFDPVALDTALAALGERNVQRLKAGREVIGDYLATLAPEERRAFADRLEKALNRRGRRD